MDGLTSVQIPLRFLGTKTALPERQEKDDPILSRFSLDVLIPDYVLTCPVEARSAKTIAWYEQKLLHLRRFLVERGYPTDANEIERQHLRAFLKYLQTEAGADENHFTKPARDEPRSAHTVHGYVRPLNAFCSWAMRERMLQENPMALTKPPGFRIS